ncbi:glycosyltransferase family 39 protein [Chloroflexota bacterium]
MPELMLTRLQSCLARPRGRLVLVALVLVISLLVRLLLSYFIHGHGVDLNLFGFWFDVAADGGISGFYNAVPGCDYPPLNVYIFWLFGKLGHAVGPDTSPFIVKLPGNLFDIATAYLIFRFLSQRFSLRVSLGVMALYAFNPATIFDLAVWGQLDSIYTFFMVASLYSALRSKYELSSGILAVAILTKPQSIVLLPVIAYIILRQGDWRRIISSSSAFLAVVYLSILPFNPDNPVAFVIDRYLNPEVGYNYYAYNSINAYNFWALLGFWEPDAVSYLGLTYQHWGILAFSAFTAFIIWQLHRRYEPRSVIYAVFLLAFGFFMLMTRIHERYLFSVFALLALGWYTRFTVLIYLGLVATYIASLAYVLSLASVDVYWIPDGHWSTYVLVPANIILFVLSIWTFYRMQRSTPPETGPPLAVVTSVDDTAELPPKARREIKLWSAPVGVAVLTVIFFAVSVWNLGDLRAPGSDYVPVRDQEDIYLDLGETVRVDRVYLLLQDTTQVDVDVYWGTPENWSHQTSFSRSQVWRKWEEIWLGQETRYVRLEFKEGLARIGEVALTSGDRVLDIVEVRGGNGGLAAALIDEQDLFSHPASHKAGTYFDEIYYVRAAEEHIQLEVFPGWDHPTPGELTHPPTSKLIILTGIGIFGENPFAWRIGGVILATLMIPLIYLFASSMFGSSRAGLIAAFLLTFDLMHFAESRIATPETFILFFVMGMFYFFYRYWQDPEHRGRDLFISLVFFGLGFSTKWVVMWGFGGMILLLLLLKWRTPTRRCDRILINLVSLAFSFVPLVLIPFKPDLTRWLVLLSLMFGFIPRLLLLLFPQERQQIQRKEIYWFIGGAVAAVSIYLLSNIPYFLAGWGLGDIWNHQFFMFGFHSGLTAPHPYSSEWYTWPVMLKPLWMYVGSFDGTKSYIATFGNPALWWGSIPVMIATLWLVVRYRNRIAIFIMIPFLTQWLIFAAIGRVLFIYHFYPNVLFIILALTMWIEWLWGRYRWGKWAMGGFLALNVVCFALFFPVVSGLPMAESYWDALRWMVSWIT